MKSKFIMMFLFVLCSPFVVLSRQQDSKKELMGSVKGKYQAYLFTYFTGKSKDSESIRFALSLDGYRYRALNHNNPVISSTKISSTGGVRDPHILRAEDGKTFYMIATDMVAAKGWDSNRAMVFLKSTDLVNWTSSVVNIQTRFPGKVGNLNNDSLMRVWAPQTIYDPQAKKYMVYFSMKHGKTGRDKIYYAYANADFTDLEDAPKQLFHPPGDIACIDGDIIYAFGKYNLFFKTEGVGKGIKKATSDKLTGGYVMEDNYLQQTTDPVEGAGIFKLNNENSYILMYDVYTKGRYQFTRSKDLKNFQVIDQEVSMNFHPRHGTIIPITTEEVKRLVAKWLPDEDIAAKTASVPVKEYGNPVLPGLYADPDIIYAEKTGKFYMYPTSDGFTDWMGTSFKAFSSEDLLSWKDEGTILDLKKDVSWADVRAWAPCIIERKINGQYKYFYYFCAEQKIGVAVSDHPAGPFKDLGKPLIDKHPQAIARKGQIIDPDVFQDPQTGKYYLYWGNGYMAGAELNDDMVSIKPETIVERTPPNRMYTEGTHVFYRKGKYYFLWSQNDTRDPNYRVRYGISDSPLGLLSFPENNFVIVRDDSKGIYGTGHNSTIQIPGRDEWYLVYHRFNYPKGISMGREAGYNREVCIDKMEFNSDGTVKQVSPTHEGIKAVKFEKKGK